MQKKGWKWGNHGIWSQTWLCIPALLLNSWVTLEKSLTSLDFHSTSINSFSYWHLPCKHLAPGVGSEVSPSNLSVRTNAGLGAEERVEMPLSWSHCGTPWERDGNSWHEELRRLPEAAFINHWKRVLCFNSCLCITTWYKLCLSPVTM